MKTSIKLLAAATLATSTPSILAEVHGDPYRPVGDLNVSQKMIRKGKKSQLSWGITYPITIPDLLITSPTGTVTTKEELRVKIRVAGVAFQSGSTELPVGFWSKIGGGSWQQLFYGTGSQVDADQYVFDAVVPANTTIDFAGRARRSNGSWLDIRWTAVPDVAVVGLVNGDFPPSYAPAYGQGDIESFLSGYFGRPNNGHGNNADGVDSSNPGQGHGGPNGAEDTDRNGDGVINHLDDDEMRVTIGPRDMIYLFELASRDPGEWWFDMQDLVIVVTYESTANPSSTETNGNGNNGNGNGNRGNGNGRR